MARYAKESRLKPLNILKKAEEFFGPGGLGLEVGEQGLLSAHFEGGGGYVSIWVRKADKGSEVELETREWDYQVRQFMGKI